MIDIVKSIGEYILLPCNITKMVKEVIWEKNEQCYPVSSYVHLSKQVKTLS